MDRFENSADQTVAGVRRDLHIRPDGKYAAMSEGMARVSRGILTHGISVNRAADMFFKTANYRGEMNRLAWKKAREEFDPNVDEAAFKARAAELSARPTDEMFQQAVRFAHTNTFTAEGVGGVEWYARAMKRYPGLPHLTPIVRTPANVVTEGVKRLPFAGALIKSEREAWAKGGLAKREVLARQMVGAVAYGAVLSMWLGGSITGSQPINQQEAAAWRALRKKPYSIKLPGTDTWFDYRMAFGPFALPVLVVVDAIQHLSAAAFDGKDFGGAEDLATYAAGMLGFVMDETFVGELFDWADLARGDLSPDRIERLARRQLVSYAPLNAQARALTREFVTDQTLMDYTRSGGAGGVDEGLLEKLVETMSATWTEAKHLYTGVEDVFPVRDHHGRELKLTNTGGSFWSWLSPMRYTVESTDALDVAEHSVAFRPPYENRNVVVRHPVPGVDLSQTIEMTPKEMDWFMKESGKLYRRHAVNFIESPGWRNSHPAKRRHDLKTILSSAREQTRIRMGLARNFHLFPDLHRARAEALERLTAEAHREQADERRRLAAL